MASISNVKLGVCSVSFNGVDLGHTAGGVVVTYEPTYKEIKVDAYGETPADSVLTGERFMAKVPLAEFTIANLKNAIPQSTFAGAANARITIGIQAGQSSLSDAAQLVLHPINEGTRSYDVVMYKAIVNSTIELTHNWEDQKTIEVEFLALVDETKSSGNYLGLIGDSGV